MKRQSLLTALTVALLGVAVGAALLPLLLGAFIGFAALGLGAALLLKTVLSSPTRQPLLLAAGLLLGVGLLSLGALPTLILLTGSAWLILRRSGVRRGWAVRSWQRRGERSGLGGKLHLPWNNDNDV